VFHPQGGFEGIQQAWESMTERGRWEVTIDGMRLRCEERWLRLDPERHILYPELIYRRYVDDAWVEDAVLQIPRRCYAPDEFEQVIREHGFRIVQRWGGYAGERYGEGPELVVQFGVWLATTSESSCAMRRSRTGSLPSSSCDAFLPAPSHTAPGPKSFPASPRVFPQKRKTDARPAVILGLQGSLPDPPD
jgi:hypothetical protein